MDFIIYLPPPHGFTIIMVVINRLSKYAHFTTLKSDYTSKLVVESFMNIVVKLHGCPKTIVSYKEKCVLVNFGSTTIPLITLVLEWHLSKWCMVVTLHRFWSMSLIKGSSLTAVTIYYKEMLVWQNSKATFKEFNKLKMYTDEKKTS